MRIRYYLLSSFIAIIGFFMFTTYHAHAWSGTEVDIQAGPVDATQHQQNIDQAQPTEMISLMGDDGQVRQVPARVMTGKSVRLAFIPLISRWGIAIGADATYYYFGGFTNGLMLIAGTNTITMPLRGVALDGNNLAISDDITRDITPIYNGLHQIIRYDPNYDSLHFWLQYRDASGNMQRPYIYNQVFSQNRRFGVFWLNWQQFVRVDFKTGNALAFANRSGTWYDGIYASRASAITNDGRYVFMDDGASLIDISGNCGFTINPQAYTGSLDRNFITCPEYPLNPTSAAGYDAYHTSFYLAPDERSATYVLQPYPYTSNQQEPKRITLSPKTNSVNGIEYLALGDSYSSGEGDIGTKADGTNFYLPLTDATPNTCHISSRSYPFLLRDNWGIPSDQMYSVACSGAQVVFDYGYNPANYDGQGRRLAGNQDKTALQAEAIDQFIPGRVTQLEFIKKYKPKVITLTGGGNDVGFSDILSYCATPTIILGFLPLNDTCGYAFNPEMHRILWDAIHTQYTYNKAFIKQIQQASPDSAIYLIGYPSFIAGSSANCAANSGLLDGMERNMINDAVSELNRVQQKVAQDTGVEYINIEHALDGGRLCEGSEYMTGIYDAVVATKKIAQDANMFHPNAQGHEKIARTILTAIGNDPYGPRNTVEHPGATTIDPPSRMTLKTEIVTNNTMTTGSIIKIALPVGTLLGGSMVTVQAYSQVIGLGHFAANIDGSLVAAAQVPPQLGLGNHLLTLEGISELGDPILLYQFITITSSTKGDADDDGVPDTQDACMFIQRWFDEQTGKDICSPLVAGSPFPTPPKVIALTYPQQQSSRDLSLSLSGQANAPALVNGTDQPQKHQIRWNNPILPQASLTQRSASSDYVNDSFMYMLTGLLFIMFFVISAILLVRKYHETRYL